MRSFRVFVAVTTAAAAFCARAQQTTPTPTPGDTLPSASEITLTGHFEVPLGPTAAESAVRALGEQIDTKCAAEAIRSRFTPIWDLAVWRYMPAGPVRSLNSRVASDDDPFLTPEYLKVSARQLDYQLKVSERAARDFSIEPCVLRHKRLTRRCSRRLAGLLPPAHMIKLTPEIASRALARRG